jgi:hypothetical protein
VSSRIQDVEANCPGGTTTIALDFGRVRIGHWMIYLIRNAGTGAI